MLIEHTSNLIREHYSVTLSSGEAADAAELINNTVLVIAENTLALFNSRASVGDPLGNGLLAMVSLADEDKFPQTPPYILSHQAGFVGLCLGRVLLIGLNDVRLFHCPQDALRNTNERARLPLIAVSNPGDSR